MSIPAAALASAVLLVWSATADAADCSGSLVGQNLYSIQNDTSREQFVFVNAQDHPPDAGTWRRLRLPAERSEVTTVEFPAGQYLILVRLVNGQKQAHKYQIECQKRYVLRKDKAGVVSLMRLGD